ncbi:hypothetical protein BDW74DRAFT_183561 [Aspergillus multicolor]|uniref:uncharacterized protein n=1 Tax=Aspergillus multicolor TaxID=41759 RepID=UPI003CCD28E4
MDSRQLPTVGQSGSPLGHTRTSSLTHGHPRAPASAPVSPAGPSLLGSPSAPSTPRSAASKATDFSPATKRKSRDIQDMSIEGCWICRGGDALCEFVHVMAQADPQYKRWVKEGLVDFALSETSNAVLLCGNCHKHFDRADDPGVFFLPVDLDFFLAREAKWQALKGTEGQPATRVPTAAEYLNYQIEQKVVGVDATAGLYHPVFLNPFMNPSAIHFSDTFAPRAWHGEPAAALRRGIAALGSCNANAMGSTTLRKLRALQAVYFGCNEGIMGELQAHQERRVHAGDNHAMEL